MLSTAVAAQNAPAVDPCSLLTRAEAEKAIGTLSGPPTASQQERMKACSFESGSGNSLEVMVLPEDGLQRAQHLYKDLKPVEGVDPPAFIRRNASIDWWEFYSWKGAVTLEVSMNASPGAEEKLKAVAKQALARLK
jgi:hypothetical protein